MAHRKSIKERSRSFGTLEEFQGTGSNDSEGVSKEFCHLL